MEKFILIPGFDNYAISNKGRLKNVKNGKMLKLQISPHGYHNCVVSQNGIKKNLRIHRLVAILFIKNEENKPYVNHIDGNKLNNEISNLEWCTAKENDTHARKNKLKTGNKPVKATSIEDGSEFVFYSTGEASAILGINNGSVNRALNGKYKQTNGYKFEYLKNVEEYNLEYNNYSSL